MFAAVVEEGGDGFGVELVFDDVFDFFEIAGNVVGMGEVGDFFDAAIGVAEFGEPRLEELFGLLFGKVILEEALVVNSLFVRFGENTVDDFFGDFGAELDEAVFVAGFLFGVEGGGIDKASDKGGVFEFVAGIVGELNRIDKVADTIFVEEAGGELILVRLETDGTARINDVESKRGGVGEIMILDNGGAGEVIFGLPFF